MPLIFNHKETKPKVLKMFYEAHLDLVMLPDYDCMWKNSLAVSICTQPQTHIRKHPIPEQQGH